MGKYARKLSPYPLLTEPLNDIATVKGNWGSYLKVQYPFAL